LSLADAEVQKDIQELHRNRKENSHTAHDSDESVCSDDVLESSYPVKPRKAHGDEHGNPLDRRSSSSRGTPGVEEMLAFIKVLSKNYSAIYDAEVERERLESWAQVWYLVKTMITF
jgi:hypothetical protein